MFRDIVDPKYRLHDFIFPNYMHHVNRTKERIDN
jgi:hypothetical protein